MFWVGMPTFSGSQVINIHDYNNKNDTIMFLLLPSAEHF